MRKILSPLLLLVFVLGSFTQFSPASAQDDQNTSTAQFLEINPAKLDFVVQRGTVTRQEVTITNKNAGKVALKASFENVLPNGENGETKPANEPTPYDLKKFSTVGNPDFTLAPRESRKVQVSINVPANESPGGYYGILRFSPTERSDLPPVAVKADIATLFLVRVPGPVTEAGSIKEAYAAKADGGKVGGIFLGNQLNLVTKINNGGNVHFGTAPTFQTSDQFGKSGLKATLESRNIFPKSDRRFEATWPGIGSGLHTVTVSADLPNKPAQQQTFKVLVITPLVAGLIALVLVILVALIILGRRRKKARSRL